MSSTTGHHLDGVAHLNQSLRDIFTTPVGTRVMRRDYGTYLFELIDKNLTDAHIARIAAELARAANLWEPRVRLTNIQVVSISGGSIVIRYDGVRTTDDTEVINGVLEIDL